VAGSAAPTAAAAAQSVLFPTNAPAPAHDAAAAQAAAQQPAQPAAAAAPVAYDLKLPEKSVLDATAVDKTVAFAKEQGLSNAQAQKLLERDSMLAQSGMEMTQQKQQSDFTEYVNKLAADANADKEIGGPNLNKNVDLARAVIARFDTDGKVKAFLNASGQGNNVEVIRMLAKIGSAMAEPTKVVQPGNSASATDKREPQAVLYPSTPI
jgi:hypothetical protein